MSSVRAIEAEVSIKSGVQAECAIGRVLVNIDKDAEIITGGFLTDLVDGEQVIDIPYVGEGHPIIVFIKSVSLRGYHDNGILTLTATKEHPNIKPSYGRWGTHIDAYNVSVTRVGTPSAMLQWVSKVADEDGVVGVGIESCIKIASATTIKIQVTPIETDDGIGFIPNTYYNYIVAYSKFTDGSVERIPKDIVLQPLIAIANGQYTPSEGVDGFSDVTVNVPERVPVTESLSVTENGTYEPTEGIDGYDRVTVVVPPTVPDIQPLTVTEDGIYQASGDGYNPVTVNTGVASLRQEIASAETASGCSPLVDGLTALTTYANEVTGAEDETLSDAVETLASKYGKAEFNPFAQMYTGMNLFTSAVLPENLTIDFEGNTVMQSMNSMFRLCTGLKNLTLKNLNPSLAAPIETIFGWSSLETVTFDNCNIAPRSIAGWVRNTNIRHIYGEIDMTSCTAATVFVFQCPNLETFSFKPNTINTNIATIQNCPLSDDSLISLGNGLVQGAGKSMSSVDNRHKQRMNAILGNNVDGTFIADENGSMTLMDFITTVKGWTVT